MNVFRKKISLLIPALLLAGVIIGLGISASFDKQPASLADKSRVPMDTQKELNTLSTALSDIAAAVSPSVVNVSTTRNVAEQRLPFNDLHDHPFFRKFFGQPYSPDDEHNTYKTSSLGSGVIVSNNGHILTNNHVIENAEKITITLHDKRTFVADLVGTDPKTDLALLKIDALNLPALAFNEESDLQVGEIVVAVGIPFGLSHTVTMGIVSAVGRSNIGIVDYEDFIQTDAAINPGNSGGALVNSGGELIGINTAIFSTSGGNMGVGFAIPVKMAKEVMDSLLEHGKVVRGWLGVNIQAVTPELMEYFDLERKNGALISEVADKSPAAKAGLEQGDIVVVFNETKIDDPTDLKNIAAATAPGSTVNITVIRGGDRKNLEVTLGEYPQDGQNQTSTTNGKFYGAHLQDLTPELKRQLEIPRMINGVLVVHLDSGSPAAEVLQQNDVIIQIDRKTVSSKSELLSARKTLEQKDTILLLVHRNGRSIFLTLAP